jgi:ABC-type glycerol-3-phosphate transport system substrate-binding protein
MFDQTSNVADRADEPAATEVPGSQNVVTRRQFLGAGVAGALALGSAAVSRREIYKSIRFNATAAPVTIKLLSWEPYGEPYEYPAWVKLISNFEIANPNITVEWTGWPFSNFDQNIIAQAEAGGIDADVLMLTPEAATTLVQKFHIGVPLQSVAHSLGIEPDAAHAAFERNGNLYALGVIDVAFALIYNQLQLKQAGVKAPPTTPEEFLSSVKAVSHPPKQFGVALLNTVASGSDWWNQFQNFCLPYGGSWAKGNTLTIDAPENIKGVELWLELLNASGLKGTAEDVIDKLFDEDRITMNFVVAAGLSSLKKLAPAYYPQMRSVPPPWPSKHAIERLHPLMVNNKSKHIEEATALVKYIVSPKNLYWITEQNGYPYIPYTNFAELVPAYAKYLQTIWLKGFEETPYVSEFDILGNYTYAYAELGNIIIENVEKAVSGTTSVSAALRQAQAQAQEELHLL